MMKLLYAALILSFVSISNANELEQEQREFFDEIQQALAEERILPSIDVFHQCYDKRISCQTGRELLVQAIDEMLENDALPKRVAREALDVELSRDIPLFDFVNIMLTFKDSLPELWNNYEQSFNEKINQARATGNMDERTQEYLESHSSSAERGWTDRYEVAKALLTKEPPIQSYWDGRYYLKPRIYMFCRDDREQPCLMLMKDATGRIARLRDGTPWHQEALGFSRHKKDFYQTNGNTPSGVWRIDGVMPSADKTTVFGKFRRLIINFVGHSENEANYKKLLPQITHDHQWWREAVTARNNGRGLFRIHGTGLRSSKRKPYFPMVPTAGCVAKAENTYDKVAYKDQRLLLDKLMVSMGFDPIYDNETRILGLLYVIDIDKKEEPVTIDSLREAGILN